MSGPDLTELLSALERFCRESVAMQRLLEESGSRWRNDVRKLIDGASASQKIATDFPDIRASLQSSELNSAAIGRLTAAIRKFLVLADLPKQLG